MAGMIRTQLLTPDSTLVSAEAYNRLTTNHGSIMLFLWILPVLAGLSNYLIPLQIGARDMAFPRLNALSFWVLVPGGLLMLASFFVGAAEAGWTAYVPLSVSGPGRADAVGDQRHPAGRLVHDGRDQLRHDGLHHARPGHVLLAAAAVHLVGPGHVDPDPDGHAGADRRADPDRAGPPGGHSVLQRAGRRRSRSCGRTCSGSTHTRRCTSWSCRRWAPSPRSSRSSPASRSSATG